MSTFPHQSNDEAFTALLSGILIDQGGNYETKRDPQIPYPQTNYRNSPDFIDRVNLLWFCRQGGGNDHRRQRNDTLGRVLSLYRLCYPRKPG